MQHVDTAQRSAAAAAAAMVRSAAAQSLQSVSQVSGTQAYMQPSHSASHYVSAGRHKGPVSEPCIGGPSGLKPSGHCGLKCTRGGAVSERRIQSSTSREHVNTAAGRCAALSGLASKERQHAQRHVHTCHIHTCRVQCPCSFSHRCRPTGHAACGRQLGHLSR